MRIFPLLALLGALASCTLANCAPRPADPAPVVATASLSEPDIKTPYFVNLSTVVLVTCYTFPDGLTVDQIDKMTEAQLARVIVKSGTGTIIAHNRVLTAQHVIQGGTMCGINKRIPTTVSYQNVNDDVAILDAPIGSSPVSAISCDPYVKGKPYLMFGYAGGRDFALDYGEFSGQYIDAKIKDDNLPGGIRHLPHAALFSGETTPGMSGGPVFDLSGRIVGINNATGSGFAMSRQLADTALCTALKPAPTTP